MYSQICGRLLLLFNPNEVFDPAASIDTQTTMLVAVIGLHTCQTATGVCDASAALSSL